MKAILTIALTVMLAVPAGAAAQAKPVAPQVHKAGSLVEESRFP